MARGEGCGSGAARLALLLSIIALVLSWQAYRRTGGSIPGLDKPIVHTWDETSAEKATAEARERLLALRTRIESHGDVDRLQKDIADLRRDLERSFEGAGKGARERWQEADRALARLDERLDEGGAKAREALDQALARLREAGRNLPAEREPEPSPTPEAPDRDAQDGGR
jgi:nucleotide-binding universal stress UspA family protein